MTSDSHLHHDTAEVNGIQMHYVESGKGPLVVLLHGFPEFWYSWKDHINLLAEQGYHVIAPDLRGYNRTDSPTGIDSYELPTLATDVVELIDKFDSDQVTLVGHDWGGIIGWWLASSQPSLVSQLIVINAPHPAVSLRELKSPVNLSNSWYFFFYQLPALPEWLMRTGDFALMTKAFYSDTTTDDAFSQHEIERHKHMMQKSNVFSSAINYDRALFRLFCKNSLSSYIPIESWNVGLSKLTVEPPTLVLWGLQDRYYHRGLLDGLDRWGEKIEIRTYSDASHWLPAEYPERVVDEIIKFIQQ